MTRDSKLSSAENFNDIILQNMKGTLNLKRRVLQTEDEIFMMRIKDRRRTKYEKSANPL